MEHHWGFRLVEPAAWVLVGVVGGYYGGRWVFERWRDRRWFARVRRVERVLHRRGLKWRDFANRLPGIRLRLHT
jgi:hypothetical protein